MTMEFAADGPHAEAVLTYGQPDDPADPGFTAQMKLFAAGLFRQILFTADEVADGAVGDPVIVTGDRD